MKSLYLIRMAYVQISGWMLRLTKVRRDVRVRIQPSVSRKCFAVATTSRVTRVSVENFPTLQVSIRIPNHQGHVYCVRSKILIMQCSIQTDEHITCLIVSHRDYPITFCQIPGNHASTVAVKIQPVQHTGNTTCTVHVVCMYCTCSVLVDSFPSFSTIQ